MIEFGHPNYKCRLCGKITKMPWPINFIELETGAVSKWPENIPERIMCSCDGNHNQHRFGIADLVGFSKVE